MEDVKKEKTDKQRVRLWLNQITPRNFIKKCGQLRQLLIGQAKLLNEEPEISDRAGVGVFQIPTVFK